MSSKLAYDDSVSAGGVRYAFEYRNINTDGRWARAGFHDRDGRECKVLTWDEAAAYVRGRVDGWIDGTELRIVEITTTERFSQPVVQTARARVLAKERPGAD